jgi:hypothetical protein
MEENLVLNVVVNDGNANKSIGQMTKDIKALRGQMANLDPNSEAFRQAALAAASLKDSIDDATESMVAMQGAGSLEGFNASAGSAQQKLKNLDFDGVALQINNMANSLGQVKLDTFVSGLQSVGGSLVKLGKTLLMSPLFWFAAVIAGIVAAFIHFEDVLVKVDKTMAAVGEELANVAGKYGEMSQKLSEYDKKLTDTTKTEAQRVGLLKEYNQFAKENGLFMIDLNASLDEQNSLMSLNNDLIRDRMKIEAVANVQKEKFTQLIQDEIMLEEMKNTLKNTTNKTERALLITAINDQGKKIQGIQEEIHKLDELKDKYDDLATSQNLISKSQSMRTKEAERVANKTKEADAAQEKHNESIKRGAEEWSRNFKAANEYFDKIIYASLTTTQQLEQDYQTDLETYQGFLDKKLWSIDQFNQAVLLRQKEFEMNNFKLWAEYQQKKVDAIAVQEQKEIERRKKELEEREIRLQTLIDEEFAKFERQQQTINDVYASEELSYRQKKDLIKDLELSEIQKAQLVKDLNQKQFDDYASMIGGVSQLANIFYDFLGNLAEGNQKKEKKIRKKQFNVNKLTSAVDTGINTATAIMKAAPNIPLQILTGIQGAATIALILSKKFPDNADSGGGSSSGSGGSSGLGSITQSQPTAAALNSTGGSTPSTFTPFGNQNNKVYVVESDITNTQNSVNKIKIQQTL